MSAGVWGFIGVVVGGLLAICGQTVAELVRAHVATRDRTERRQQRAREHQRVTLVALQDAVIAYRDALSRDAAQTLPTPQSQAELDRTRTLYQALLHRVADDRARQTLAGWEAEAVRWFGRDDTGTAEREATAWDAAMRAVGEANRATE